MNPLPGILRLPEGATRTAAIAAWFQSLYEDERSVPVLVGGAAVELYTGGAYVTGDFDFVGNVPPAVARQLEKAGFQRRGRHWIHPAGEIYIELPGSSLEPGEGPSKLSFRGSRVVAISPDALIVDRLAAWQFWGSVIDGVNAYLIWRRQRRRLDMKAISKLARRRRVRRALRRLQAFDRRLAGRKPNPRELEEWAGRRP